MDELVPVDICDGGTGGPTRSTKGSQIEVKSLNQEAQAIHNVLQVFFAEDVVNPAAHQVVRRIKQTCEEMEFPVKVTRSHYHECGERYKNCVLKRVVFMWTHQSNDQSDDSKCQFLFNVNGFVLDRADFEPPSGDSALHLEEGSDECNLRLHLNQSIYAHHHSSCSSLLRKELATDIFKYAQELQSGHYVKFNDLVRFIEKRVDYRIDDAVLLRHLRYVADSCVPRTQESMKLVQRLQEVQKQEPGICCSIETTGITKSLQNV